MLKSFTKVLYFTKDDILKFRKTAYELDQVHALKQDVNGVSPAEKQMVPRCQSKKAMGWSITWSHELSISSSMHMCPVNK